MRASRAERALVAAVLVAPDADGPRRAYAAWLKEHGHALGELITEQLEGRAGEPLIAALRTRWRLSDEAVLGFDRGLVERLEVDAAELVARQRIFARGFMLRSLDLRGSTGGGPYGLATAVELFAAMPLERLRLEAMRSLQPLAAAPFLPRLAALDLVRCAVDGREVVRLLEAPLDRLRHLGLWGPPLAADEVCLALAGAPRLAALESLAVVNGPVGAAGVAALCAVPFRRLRQLNLSSNQVGVDGARALAAAPALATLEQLDLVDAIGPDGLRVLCDSPHLPATMTLRLDGAVLDLEPAFLGDHADHVYAWWEGEPPEWIAKRFRVTVVGAPE
jgi:uncharacterized protein (TIGR02996 family)